MSELVIQQSFRVEVGQRHLKCQTFGKPPKYEYATCVNMRCLCVLGPSRLCALIDHVFL